MTSQQFLVCDSSTLANFVQWASAISGFFSTAGWTKSGDTGQVNWSTIASVPAANAYVYEVWEPNDSLANFYLKVEYGNSQSSSNMPTVRLTIGTSTNGAGTMTGTVLGPLATVNNSNFTVPSASTQWECDFSGAAGRMQVMMWRNATAGDYCTQIFSVERSLSSSGAYTSAHVTVTTVGPFSNSGSWSTVNQQTLLFGVGVAPAASVAQVAQAGGLPVRVMQAGSVSGSSGFNGSLGFDLQAPYVGFFDCQLTGVGASFQPDIVEGVPFTVTVYGATRTYMPTKFCLNTQYAGPYASRIVTCMRYD